MGDKFVKSWEMKNPNAKHTLVVELWERSDGTRYRKTHKKWQERWKGLLQLPLFSREGVHDMFNHKATKLMKFVSFTIAIWILCIAYAVVSLGD